MSGLGKKFNKKEISLFVLLLLVIAGALYYYFVFAPVYAGLSSANTEKAELESELVKATAKAELIGSMQDEMENVDDNGHILSRMPSYNAGKQEIDFLHSTLSARTIDYYVAFTELSRMGNQIRRHFDLNFSVDKFEDAEQIIDELENSEIRCLIENMVVVPLDNGDSILDEPVEVNCVATFYETMYGGQEDSDLPKDSAPIVETETGSE